MKSCPVCQKTYDDNDLNFCLNDGATLEYQKTNDAPPTVLLNQARMTNEMNWQSTSPPQPGPMSTWQNTPLEQNPGFSPQASFRGQDQTLPIISLVLGILSIFLVCCYGGIYFGIPALIIGYLGLNNSNNNPSQYGGRGMAIAGMILGGVSLISVMLIIMLAIIGNM